MSVNPVVDRFIGDETPIKIWWFVNGALLDLTTGYTFEAKLYRADDATRTVIFTKTTGMTGAAGSGTSSSGTPNLTVTWSTTGELNTNTITSGRHVLQLKATAADSTENTYEMYLDLRTRV